MAHTPKKISPAFAIVLIVVALLGGVLVAKSLNQAPAVRVASTAATGAAVPARDAAETITSTHNDAVGDYDAALKTGKPIYLLFHSLTCDPCVEISAVVDDVLPQYEGRVVFVNAISDDPSAKQLAAQFRFQYIPTSFFITPDGKVADSFTGSMSAVDLKARLDQLVDQ